MAGLVNTPIDSQTDSSMWEPQSLGARELPSFENTAIRQPVLATPAQETGIDWDKWGNVIEAFGAGIKGEEPLWLKERRQKMLEDQQRQEQAFKLTQMKQQQSQQQFEQAWGIITNPNANAETKIGALNSIADNNQVAKSLSPFATKQIVGDIARALPYIDPKLRGEFEKLRQDSSYKPNIPGGISAVEAEVKRGVKLADDDEKATGDDRRYDTVLEEARAAGGLTKLSKSKQDFVIKRAQEAEERQLKVQELDQKLQLTTSQAKVAKATEPAQIAEAKQKAATRTRELLVDMVGTTQTQEWQPNKGWVTIATGKKSPTVSVNIGEGERKERTEALTLLSSLKNLKETFKPEYVGMLDSKLGKITSTLNLIGQGESDFRSNAQLLRTELRKFYFGTAQSKQELEGALESLPSLDLGDTQFLSSVKASVGKVQRYIVAQDQVLQEAARKPKPTAADRYTFLTEKLGADKDTAYAVMHDEGYAPTGMQ